MVSIVLQRVKPLTVARGEKEWEKLEHICKGQKNKTARLFKLYFYFLIKNCLMFTLLQKSMGNVRSSEEKGPRFNTVLTSPVTSDIFKPLEL